MNHPFPRHILLPLALLASVLAAGPAAGSDPETPLLGFSADGAATERALEQRLDAAITPAEQREWMKLLSAHPHHVGSPGDLANAEWLRDQFTSWGYRTRIETFQVLFPTPKKRVLEMTSPRHWRARLEEPAVPGDSTSGQKSEQLPTYNAYSVDGDVEGEVVYVNYGVPADYDELARRGIDVRGKIVLARYGGSWRGIKPKVAAEHGAVGCVIYSDPAGDGYFQGDVWPDGGWRSRDSVQRGSVADMPLYSGDPLTPGVGATADAHRLPVAESPVLTKIPVLPISYGDAQPILAELAGPMAPEAWRGNLPLPYHLGPGPVRLHLALAFDWSLKPIHDVIAVLPGSEWPDEWVIRGNHQDAWVDGAMDPLSGLVALLAEAKAVGAQAAAGFRPRRTVVYAAWDGEEPGLLGSTEWAETHAEELTAKAVAYVNTDSIGRGFLSLGGSHSLERFFNQAARDVADPETGVSILERARAQRILDAGAANVEARDEARDRPDLRLEALGSGSDYTPFLQHLGVAALDFGFGGEEQYGQYHSIYDSFDHYVRFGDPGFEYPAAAARLGARLVLRLAQADVLPIEPEASAAQIADYAREVEKLTADERGQAEERGRLLAGRTFELTSDPTQPLLPPPALDAVPFLEFAPLDNAVARLAAAAQTFRTSLAAFEAGGPDAASVAAVNRFLAGFERLLTSPDGLPGRPWYRHEIYAPGLYTGYGVKTLPAIREPIELRQWTQVDGRILDVAGLLDRAAAALDAESTRLAPAGD